MNSSIKKQQKENYRKRPLQSDNIWHLNNIQLKLLTSNGLQNKYKRPMREI